MVSCCASSMYFSQVRSRGGIGYAELVENVFVVVDETVVDVGRIGELPFLKLSFLVQHFRHDRRPDRGGQRFRAEPHGSGLLGDVQQNSGALVGLDVRLVDRVDHVAAHPGRTLDHVLHDAPAAGIDRQVEIGVERIEQVDLLVTFRVGVADPDQRHLSRRGLLRQHRDREDGQQRQQDEDRKKDGFGRHCGVTPSAFNGPEPSDGFSRPARGGRCRAASCRRPRPPRRTVRRIPVL